MTLLHIAVFSVIAALSGLIAGGRWRKSVMLVASILAIYWLQSVSPIRYMDFWLPTATLMLVVFVWIASWPAGAERPEVREALSTAGAIIIVILIVGAVRYLGPVCCITPSLPPSLPVIALALLAVGGLTAGIARLLAGRRGPVIGLMVLILALLLVLKTEPLAQAASMGLRAMMQQSVERASALDLRWLGFSYVAFRLLHVLLDRVYGRLPALTLQEFVIYTVFFPAFVSGPIDRAERFVKDLRADYTLTAADVLEGGRRIVVGLFRKFVLADSLALIALNGQNALQVTSPVWLWVLLYAYAFRLYFDFAGYTDIAIGIGRLMGVHLPENFDRPYLKPNLTAFWNSWHMTLAQWFRAYYFNPLTRALRSSPRRIPAGVIIALGQLTTMILIGLWHGVTWNFVIWGAWHGIGLFIHNRWTNAMRTRLRNLEQRPVLNRLYTVASVVLTFHFVLLSWVWFALPTVGVARSVMLSLFGV